MTVTQVGGELGQERDEKEPERRLNSPGPEPRERHAAAVRVIWGVGSRVAPGGPESRTSRAVRGFGTWA